LRYLSRTAFRTGECWAAQSIFLWPSGARAESLTIDSLLCMALLLACPLGFALFGGHHLIGGLDLLPPAEQEGAD
jgi:hypothetical protein